MMRHKPVPMNPTVQLLESSGPLTMGDIIQALTEAQSDVAEHTAALAESLERQRDLRALWDHQFMEKGVTN